MTLLTHFIGMPDLLVEQHVQREQPQARAAEQVVADHRGQAQAEGSAMVMPEQAVALHHDDVQAVMGVAEDAGILGLKLSHA